MRSALVFYLVVTIVVVVISLPEPCVIEDYTGKIALCGRQFVKYTFDFIPPISQNITYISLWGQPLKQLPYNAFRNLSSQSSISMTELAHCEISHVDAGALLNLHNLTTLDLSYNDINQIDSKLFSDTKQIEFINMGYNKIKVVPNGVFENLLQLEVVYLHHNRIRQVENYSFKNTPSLKVIYLSNNQIEVMSMLFKDEFDNLTTLLLNDNPWRCNCELGPLYELLKEINQLNQQELVCEKPPALHGRKWSDISKDELVCRSEDAMSTEDSVITNTEPVDTGIPQPPSNQNWIPYTISVVVLVCVAAVIIGVVLFKRRSDRRTNARHMDRGLPLRVQSSAVSKNGDMTSNMADVDEESMSIRHYEIREATAN